MTLIILNGQPVEPFDFAFDFRIPTPPIPGPSPTAPVLSRTETPTADSSMKSLPNTRASASVQPLRLNQRRMVSAILLGKHTHVAKNGIRIYIFTRGGAYIARGRLNGSYFGPTLGRSAEDAEHALRRLLQELEEQTFLRPSEGRQKKPQRICHRLPVGRLVDDFLASARRRLGKPTTRAYASRLAPLSEFVDLPEINRRWRAARDVDEGFAIAYVDWLFQKPVHPNGHPNSKAKLRSPENVRLALETARAVFRYASKAKQLPNDFANPFIDEIMPVAFVRDPVRPNPTPLAHRIRMVEVMDEYELLHLILPFVYGVRPEDFCSRLISDMDFENRLLRFHARFGGADFSKGRVEFILPLPEALVPLVHRLVGERPEGPLLRRRGVWSKIESPLDQVASLDDVSALVDRRRAASSEVRCSRDLKDIVQQVVRDLGGPSVDQLRDVYLPVRERAGLAPKRLYDLKHAVTIEMTGSGVKQISATYLTGHRIPSRDVMAGYDGVDPYSDIQPYFRYAKPLFDAMLRRATELGLQEDPQGTP